MQFSVEQKGDTGSENDSQMDATFTANGLINHNSLKKIESCNEYQLKLSLAWVGVE